MLLCIGPSSEVLFSTMLEIIVLEDCLTLLELSFFLVISRPTDLCVCICESVVEVILSFSKLDG